MSTRASAAGLSLIEVTIVLAVMAVLGAVVAPASMDVAARTRTVRADQDGQAIQHGILQLLNDTGKRAFRTSGAKGTIVDLLVSDGRTPAEMGAGADPRWVEAVGRGGVVDFLDRHLVTNTPGGSASNAWLQPAHLDGAGWRGAYVSGQIEPDPWGNRYAVNVRFLGTTTDVVVLSAGPDGTISTSFEGRGLVAGGDDVVVLVR